MKKKLVKILLWVGYGSTLLSISGLLIQNGSDLLTSLSGTIGFTLINLICTITCFVEVSKNKTKKSIELPPDEQTNVPEIIEEENKEDAKSSTKLDKPKKGKPKNVGLILQCVNLGVTIVFLTIILIVILSCYEALGDMFLYI